MTSINIDASLMLASQDFKYVGEVEYEQFGGGMCVEGHPIKYGIELADENNNIYVFGSTCVYKPYVLKQWKLDKEMLDNPNVIRAGRNLWIIARDGLSDYISEIPHPKDYEWDFVKLNEILKQIVSKAKSTKKAKEKRLLKEASAKAKVEDFRKRNKIQHDLVVKMAQKLKTLKEENKLQLISDWDHEFIISVINQHNSLRILSDKQLKIIQRIINYPTEITGDSEIEKLLLSATKKLNTLNEREQEFILSFQRQYYAKGMLSEKQMEVLHRIIYSDNNKYVGAQMTKWITEQKTGIDAIGIIISVEAKTEKALLAKFKVEDKVYKNWIPISQVTLLEKD